MAKKKPRDDLSIRAYAKLRACDDKAVRRAIASGRLVKSIEQRAGQWRIVDADLADREWAENTQHDRVPVHVMRTREKLAATAGEETYITRAAKLAAAARAAAMGDDPDADLPSACAGDSLTRADAIKKVWEAKLAEQKFRQIDGELVEAKAVAERWADIIAAARTKLLGIPSKVKQRIPKLTRKELEVIDELIREALEDLATGESRK